MYDDMAEGIQSFEPGTIGYVNLDFDAVLRAADRAHRVDLEALRIRFHVG
jgi:hypothetical protein